MPSGQSAFELIAIPFSHYNEKARWALDYAGVSFFQRSFMPMFHLPAVAWATRGVAGKKADRASSPFSTPVLKTDRGEVLCDSRQIVRYVSDRFLQASLYPTRGVSEWEERFHDELGPHTRRVAYDALLRRSTLVNQTVEHNVAGVQRLLARVCRPLLTASLRKALSVHAAEVSTSRERIIAVFDDVSTHLRQRQFLVGEAFTAADLAFACMAAPALVVQSGEGYGAWLPALEALPASAQAFSRTLRQTIAGQHALRMFAVHRKPNTAART